MALPHPIPPYAIPPQSLPPMSKPSLDSTHRAWGICLMSGTRALKPERLVQFDQWGAQKPSLYWGYPLVAGHLGPILCPVGGLVGGLWSSQSFAVQLSSTHRAVKQHTSGSQATHIGQLSSTHRVVKQHTSDSG